MSNYPTPKVALCNANGTPITILDLPNTQTSPELGTYINVRLTTGTRHLQADGAVKYCFIDKLQYDGGTSFENCDKTQFININESEFALNYNPYYTMDFNNPFVFKHVENNTIKGIRIIFQITEDQSGDINDTTPAYAYYSIGGDPFSDETQSAVLYSNLNTTSLTSLSQLLNIDLSVLQQHFPNSDVDVAGFLFLQISSLSISENEPNILYIRFIPSQEHSFLQANLIQYKDAKTLSLFVIDQNMISEAEEY